MNKDIKPIDECKTLQELFADPSRWAQNGYAYMTEGTSKIKVWPFDERADCFCLSGGFCRIYDNEKFERAEAIRIRNLICIELKGCLVAWNDDPARTFADVQALVKKLNL